MKKNDRMYYPAIFKREKGKSITITFPDLDCDCKGKNDADALLKARDCLGKLLCDLEVAGKKLPKATALHDVKTAKDETAVLIDVFMPAVRAAHITRSVSRSVTLPAYLNALALENKINFSRVLQDALKQELNLD